MKIEFVMRKGKRVIRGAGIDGECFFHEIIVEEALKIREFLDLKYEKPIELFASPQCFNATELINEFEPLRKAAEAKITIDGDGITIEYSPNHTYFIERERISTPEALVSWMLHLGTKGWMSKMMMESFAERVAKEVIGFSPHTH